MNHNLSPKYQMDLVSKLAKHIDTIYKDWEDKLYYIQKWQVDLGGWNNQYENFRIVTFKTGEIKLYETLQEMDGETLLKIAIDLGLETPDYIPQIPHFKNEVKSSYSTAFATFEKAVKQVEEDPSLAIGLANSALESIIKHILKDEKLKTEYSPKKTLYDLASELLKELQLYPSSTIPKEIKTIGSSFLAACQNIEKLRSEKTNMHGKGIDEHIIQDPIFAYFVINSVATVGLFFISFYKLKFPNIVGPLDSEIDLPF